MKRFLCRRKRRVKTFVVRECRKTHHIKVRAANCNQSFKMVQDTGSEHTYIDLHMAKAWGLVVGRKPVVAYRRSTTVDSNGKVHKSLRLIDVELEILCPDGVFRGSRGPVEVNLDQETNKFGRLYGVGHIRTLGDSVQYLIDFKQCMGRNTPRTRSALSRKRPVI